MRTSLALLVCFALWSGPGCNADLGGWGSTTPTKSVPAPNTPPPPVAADASGQGDPAAVDPTATPAAVGSVRAGSRTVPLANPPDARALPNPTAAPQPTAPPVVPPMTINLVRLSAGAALPQSLPSGTTMSFSVDYDFRGKSPDGSSRYFWVIERTLGTPVALPVQLKGKGNLVQFVRGFRPEHGPFRCYISERQPTGQVRKISSTVPLT